ncbi:MAG: hypothetical protein ACT6FG_01270 [Methanosarcinaceae archaeon]
MDTLNISSNIRKHDLVLLGFFHNDLGGTDRPAIKWKLQNILKLKLENQSKHDHMMELLEKVLSE